MDIDVKRLETDLDYWDSIAPEGATHFIVYEDKIPNKHTCFYTERGDRYIRCGTVIFWRKKDVHPNYFLIIPHPAHKQWSGPEDGLPTVGMECEYDDCDNGWVPTIILAHHPDGSNAWHQSVKADGFSEGRSYSTDSARSFRPLKTEKERVIEWALSQDCEPHEGTMSRKEFCEALYDAGALKMPGGE